MNEANYIIPKECEDCGSDNVIVRVIYDKGITRYMCLDCGSSRSIAKSENLKRRSSTPLNHWSKRVIRHHPFCNICGSKENLEAHHIIPVSHCRGTYSHYMYLDTNGITLCKKCHSLVHRDIDQEERI
jgi:ssDNA-binding Zn-finger/Zn-ribbon topoisomerase 1